MDDRLRALDRGWRGDRTYATWLAWAVEAERSGHAAPRAFIRYASRCELRRRRLDRLRAAFPAVGTFSPGPSARESLTIERVAEGRDLDEMRGRRALRRLIVRGEWMTGLLHTPVSVFDFFSRAIDQRATAIRAEFREHRRAFRERDAGAVVARRLEGQSERTREAMRVRLSRVTDEEMEGMSFYGVPGWAIPELRRVLGSTSGRTVMAPEVGEETDNPIRPPVATIVFDGGPERAVLEVTTDPAGVHVWRRAPASLRRRCVLSIVAAGAEFEAFTADPSYSSEVFLRLRRHGFMDWVYRSGDGIEWTLVNP